MNKLTFESDPSVRMEPLRLPPGRAVPGVTSSKKLKKLPKSKILRRRGGQSAKGAGENDK